MKKWEYYSLKVNTYGFMDVDKCNLLGKQGWELVTTNSTLNQPSELIFKREIK